MPIPAKGKWTFETCIESAKNFFNKKSWQKGAGGAFKAAKREEWLSICITYFKKKD